MFINLILYLVFFGFVLWVISFIPMENNVKKIVQGLALFLLILYVLRMFGVIS